MNSKQKMDASKAIDFLEELIWLLESKKNIKLKDIPNTLREIINNPEDKVPIDKKYASPNPNVHFLIGVLPRLFTDESLFPSNASIIQFATEVLGIEVTRSGKRSRYELIGLIVCETDKLSDSKLDKLVLALAQITGNEEKLNRMKEYQNSSNFSWNETIQKLTESNYE